MKIALVNQWYLPEDWGGVPVSVHALARGLSDIGHEVTVVTSTNNHQDINTVRSERGVRVIRLKRRNFFSRLGGQAYLAAYNFHLTRALRQIVKDYKIEILEYVDVNGEYFFHRAMLKLPYVVRLQTPLFAMENLYSQKEWGSSMKLIFQMEKMGIVKADALISPSRSMAGIIAKACRLPLEKIRIIPNPLNEEPVYAGKSEGFFKFPPNAVMFVGRLEKRKGVFVFAEAIPDVYSEFPEANFVFMGPDRITPSGESSESTVKKYLKAKNIPAERVYFLGQVPREKLYECYKNAAVVAVPALYEDYPYSVVEPMAAGAAVVASDCYGIPEIIRHGETGLLAKSGDSKDFARHIVDLLANNTKRAGIAQKGKMFIESECSPVRIAELSVEIYGDVLKRKRGR